MTPRHQPPVTAQSLEMSGRHRHGTSSVERRLPHMVARHQELALLQPERRVCRGLHMAQCSWRPHVVVQQAGTPEGVIQGRRRTAPGEQRAQADAVRCT